jgi:hypothetical protein
MDDSREQGGSVKQPNDQSRASGTPPPHRGEHEPVTVGSIPAQNRALDAARDAGQIAAGAALLKTTGPLAEMMSAEQKGILDEARRILIAKKGRGVVFEAATVVQLQDASERYGFRLTARLAAEVNNPRADVLVSYEGANVELQLKVGEQRYIRAAIHAQKEGTLLFVPKGAAEGSAVSALDLDGVVLEAPTKEQLLSQTRRTLDRLSAEEPVVTFADAAKRALTGCVVDGVVVAVVDLCSQVLEKPERPIDWRRTGRVVLKASATSAVTSLLATANTATALKATGRAVELASVVRGTRMAAAIVPHAIDVCFDIASVSSGEMTYAQFARSAAGHAGAAAVEYLAFPYITRLAARLGPLGGILALVAGGLLASFVGRKVGEFLYDAAVDFLSESAIQMRSQAPEARLSDVVTKFQREAEEEAKRRVKQAENHQCEEPRCARPHHARGMCKKHYMNWWRRQRRVDWRLYSWALRSTGHTAAPVIL